MYCRVPRYENQEVLPELQLSQIGIFYKPFPSQKKKMFLIKLNGLILTGDTKKTSETLLQIYSPS
jgi:hypothetical protein